MNPSGPSSINVPPSRPSQPMSIPARTSLPIVAPGYTTAALTDKISAVVLRKMPKWWYPAFGAAFALLNLFLVSVGWLFIKGIGIWGINVPVAWGRL